MFPLSKHCLLRTPDTCQLDIQFFVMNMTFISSSEEEKKYIYIL